MELLNYARSAPHLGRASTNRVISPAIAQPRRAALWYCRVGVGSLAVAGIMLFGGCAEQRSAPLGPGSDTAVAPGIPSSQFQPLEFLASQQELPQAAGKLATEPVLVSKPISADRGGKLQLHWKSGKGRYGRDRDTGTDIKVGLKIPRGALTHDAEISIQLENPARATMRVDLTFGEHGTQFLIPAELKLKAMGLDLSGYGDVDSCDLYGYDPATDSWFPVSKKAGSLSIDVRRGTIRGTWYLDHFSRYALSGGGGVGDDD